LMDKLRLIYPDSYGLLTQVDKDEMGLNAIGPAFLPAWVKLSVVFGLDLSEAGNIHDYQYATQHRLDGKLISDLCFCINSLILAVNGFEGRYFRTLARVLVIFLYFIIVYTLGLPYHFILSIGSTLRDYFK